MGYLLPFDRNISLGQPFGARPGMSPNPSGGHNGDDWLTPVGVAVRAAGDGVVVFAGEFDDTYADNFGWNLHYGGLMVVLNMDGDTAPYFEYGHLSRVLVQTGQRVSRGQVIAITGNTDGNTGISTGPHCHVGCLPHNFNLNTNTYGRVNPRLFMTDYWDGSTGPISVQSVPVQTENPIQEDEMSAADVAAIRGDLNTVHEAVKASEARSRADVATVHNTIIRDVGGQLAGLREALGQVAAGAGVEIDYGRVEDAARRGAEDAMANGVVKVDVTVEGGK